MPWRAGSCALVRGRQCSFYELRQYKIVYRRYASLFFMVGVDEDEVRSFWGGRGEAGHLGTRSGEPWGPEPDVEVMRAGTSLLARRAPLAHTPHLQNELAILEFIHCFVEVLDKHFGQVCELDIMNEPEMVRRSPGGSPPTS